MLDSKVTLVELWGKLPDCLSWWLYMHPTSNEEWFLLLLTLQRSVLSYIFSLAVLIGVEKYIMILVYNSLIVHDGECMCYY